MYKEAIEDRNWFYIDNQRAMISLGPLNSSRTCPYNCAFCYVQDGFIPYAKKSIEDILDFLVRHRKEYEIIYVSGDTDSFAVPRKAIGISLLQQIAKEIDCDLLFTTRTTFSDDELIDIAKVVETLKMKKKELFSCISITRYSETVGYLEPAPIPSPNKRIEILRKLHNVGAVTVLALRPFLPVVPSNDYFTILQIAKDFVDIVLGEAFYFSRGGSIESRVFPQGIPSKVLDELKLGKMDFNSSQKDWAIWQSDLLESQILEYCKKHNIIFAMRSGKAIAEYKAKSKLLEDKSLIL